MCLILKGGEIRQINTKKTKKNEDLIILRVLAKIGKTELFMDIANFSKQTYKLGPCELNVVPRASAGPDGRVYLNWATYE